ncbi:MAG TPA: protein kinase [Ktedonobacteraceae bacterium]
MSVQIGQQWGNYRLTRLLGSGAFANVYLGKHVRLDMQAAVKILRTSLHDQVARSFQQEAQVIATLLHPHIVRLLDFAIQDGQPFLVLEYAPFGSLNQKYPHGAKLPLPLVVDYAYQAASALQYAHEKKLVHRDVKPANMLIGREGELLLSDFGIATIAHSTSSLALESILGTPLYMSPEQIQGHPRAASDQYALGIAVYQWLTGQTPFQGLPREIITQHLATPPSPIHEHVPQIPEEVEQVILRALAKEPRARFDSVFAFANALQQAVWSLHPARESSSLHTSQTSMLTSAIAVGSVPGIQETPLTPQPESLTAVQNPPSIDPGAESERSSPTLVKAQRTLLLPDAVQPALAAGSAPGIQETPLTPLPESLTAVQNLTPLDPGTEPERSSPTLVKAQRTLLLPGAVLLASPFFAQRARFAKNPLTELLPGSARLAHRVNTRGVLLIVSTIFLVLLVIAGATLLAVPASRHPLQRGTAPGLVSELTQAAPAGHPTSTVGTGQPAPTATPTTGSNPSSSSSSSSAAPASQPTPTPASAAAPQSTSVPAPAPQPTSAPAPAPQPTPTPVPVPDCLRASPTGITVTQVLGANASLPGSSITLTNCSAVSGHWTASVQYNSGSGWASCNPASGTISANSSQTIHLAIGSPGVLLGTYGARLILSMGNASATVGITLVVIL